MAPAAAISLATAYSDKRRYHVESQAGAGTARFLSVNVPFNTAAVPLVGYGFL